jgi:hypothetical protein
MSIEPHSTSSQLKHDIDSGRTGDKAGGFDPAAAPLGTDDEAGGAAASPEAISHARAMETVRGLNSRTTNAAQPELQPDARMKGPSVALPVVLGIGAAAALAAALVALL